MSITYEIARRSMGLRHAVKRIEWRRDLPVPMTDGAVLLADHVLPVGIDDAPLLLVRCPYGRRSLIGQLYGRYFAHQGFQVMVQSCRGTAGSGGRFDQPFQREREDGADTVAWLRRQPFYPGRFATIGGSYLGYTQLALPEEARAEQVAAVLQVAVTRVADIAWSTGALALEAPLAWAITARRGPDRAFANMLRARRDARAIRTAGRRAPLSISYVEATGAPVSFLEDWWSHAAGDPWWSPQDQGRALDEIDCPVLIQAGWYDLLLGDGLEQYRRLSERRSDVRLTIGPWSHATFGTKGGKMVLSEAAEFLHAIFANGTVPGKPVRLLDARSGSEERLDAWPPETRQQTLFISAGGLSDQPQVADGGTTSFRYDPDDPTPAVGGALLGPRAGRLDNAVLERRSDVVHFDTATFEATTVYAGSPEVELWISADVPAPQVFVRLNLIDRDGRSTNVTDRLIVASLDQADGSPTRVTVVLPPTCLRIEAGERLRLVIAGGAFPRFARSSGTLVPPLDATDFRQAHIAVHHSVDGPSTLSLQRRSDVPAFASTA